MVTHLQVRHCKAPARPTVAWFLPGDDPEHWLAELTRCALARADTRLFVVPRGASDPAAAGLLVVPESGRKASSRPAGLACGLAGERLFLPVEAALSPAISADELRGMCRLPVMFFHPILGLSGFEHEATLRVWDLLALPQEYSEDWNQARVGSPEPARLCAIMLVTPPTVEQVFGQESSDIGSEAATPLPPGPGEPPQGISATAGRRLKLEVARRMAALLQRLRGSSQRSSRLKKAEDSGAAAVGGDIQRSGAPSPQGSAPAFASAGHRPRSWSPARHCGE